MINWMHSESHHLTGIVGRSLIRVAFRNGYRVNMGSEKRGTMTSVRPSRPSD